MEEMVRLFCIRHHHTAKQLCSSCQTFLDYALERLNKCPFGHTKPVCSDCAIHCYSRAMRAEAKRVMRYSGPRMLLVHPFLAAMHWADKISKKWGSNASQRRGN